MHAKLLSSGRAWPDNESTYPRQTNFAHNFPRSLLEIARKRCNPNDMNSMFEVLAGELRAKLLWRGPLHPLRGATPDQKGCTAYGSGAAHQITRATAETARRRPGCGACGRRRGLAGLRVDAPSEARRADGSRAGRRPRAHQAARPAKQREAARPHRDQAACTSGDSCQKSPISQHSRWRRRGRLRR